MVADKKLQFTTMAFLFVHLLTFFFICFLHPVAPLTNSSTHNDLETYIVILSPPPEGLLQVEDLHNWYDTFLPETTTQDETPRMVFRYRNVITGFAAKLSAEEAKAMEKLEGVLSATPQRVLPLHTTHTPNFLGLNQNVGLWRNSNYGKGLIIGLLDTGITPLHPSFNDDGMPPPPAKWKGICELNTTVGACNNKLIGARTCTLVYRGPPTDEIGHGTHTASTAAGNYVRDANVFGNANGTAAGIAPLAHIAMYKVCYMDICDEGGVLAGMDAAIEDGVDVISLSLGYPSLPFHRDSLAIGTFTAAQKGIFVTSSAGNFGPSGGLIANVAPWILTVGASTIDRKITSTVGLGNNESFEGETLVPPKNFPGTFLPLISPIKNESIALCDKRTFEGIDVKGKIVLCDYFGGIYTYTQGEAVKDAGGAAMILVNKEAFGATTFEETNVLPAVHVGYKVGVAIKAYINSTASPMAKILFKGTVIGDVSAPQVASFSSRGPSKVNPGILKPDIIGPGVNILAAWDNSVEGKPDTKANFNIKSGTSMSCPHLAGVAALLKSLHPDWSPAAIKSAIMTTADVVDLSNNSITDERELKADLLAIGAGHVNPSKASNPGLVYDIQPDDYIHYLCGLGYPDDIVQTIARKNISCTNITQTQLNYPSFATILMSRPHSYTRTLTNVGEVNSSYVVEIYPPQGVRVDVKPSSLYFSTLNQQLSYEVTFKPETDKRGEPFVEGFLIWKSDKHSVRSPISVNLI